MSARDAGTKAACQVQPVNAFLEERVAAGHRLVVAPVVGRLEAPGERREVREHHLPDRIVGQQAAESDGQRLVVVVLADQHHAIRPRLGVADREVVLGVQIGRLLDQHVLAGGQGLQRQRQVESRRHGDDDGVDRRVGDGRVVVVVAGRAAELPAVRVGPGSIAARVGDGNPIAEGAQMTTMDACDVSASEEGNAQRSCHSKYWTHRADRWTDRVYTGPPSSQRSGGGR